MKLQNGSMNISDFSERELQYMQVVSLVTGDEFLNNFDLDLDTNQFFSYLENITLDMRDTFYTRRLYMNEYVGVELSRIITFNGYCYSFNIPDADNIFHVERLN